MPGSRSTLKTPQLAAFFVSGILLGSCQQNAGPTELSEQACLLEPLPIADIQGEGDVSPILNEAVTTRGIVTHLQPDDGVFIEQASSDDSPDTSDGLFIQNKSLATAVRPGDLLVVSGTVAEIGEDSDTLTALQDIEGYRVCASQQALMVSRVQLPMSPERRESLEAMHLAFQQELFVTDPRNAGRGLLTLSKDGKLPIPTEVARPGKDAREQSAKNRRSSLRIRLFEDETQLLPAGTTVLSLKGVMGHDGKGLRLLQKEPLNIIPIRVNRTPPPGEADVRVISLNLLNYFNGDGHGGGFPTSRGAETPAEFNTQRDRLAATVEHLQPHLVAVMELENDGFDKDSAAQDFIDDLERASGHSWQAVRPWDGPVGSGVITVGFFYRTDRLAVVGKARVLTGPGFDGLSRVPMAQQFKDKRSGQTFVAVVNHLKSKGSCPADGRNANLKDGQGCWNLARTQAATTMARWTLSLANSATAGRALVLGDMNAYRMEDPIRAIIETGLIDLKASGALKPEFSYIFAGQAGSLDYAFASSALRPFVHTAMILNFNSPYARELDLPLPWLGASDHDPVLVDLRFRQSSTSD